ncbi:hypothetical protein PTTG_28606 [Puccinia triticina 1-1 BBBD Race 1]|uniref:Helicase C-terminal domain-containing protein n=2 Tax=Puccinia triticina TaxID=208348 RepID=A0A180GAI2_PUCT1|nr:hypothetical protein PTTG_28606 [Puccinia triticina 1-1 BBBD Race 1]
MSDLERLLTQKLKGLRQDLGELHSLKVDWDSLKRDAILDEINVRMDNILNCWLGGSGKEKVGRSMLSDQKADLMVAAIDRWGSQTEEKLIKDFWIHSTQPTGDILVFFTGQDEIKAAQEPLEETARSLGNKIGELKICPIYTNLPTEMQAKIFEPPPNRARQVILATNIARKSDINIDGVVHVIDPCF